MPTPNKLRLKVARRRSLPRWMLVPDLYDPCVWWVKTDGGWASLRAPSYEEAQAFCEGLFGPSSAP